MSTPDKPLARPFTGRTVFWIIGSFFAVIFAANIVLVRLALDSNSGIVEDGAYDKGLAYNDRLRATQRQAALGWSLGVDAVRGADGETRFTLNAVRGGTPLAGLNVTAKLVRAVTEGHDVSLQFVEAGDGIYVAVAPVAMPGQWDLRVLVSRGEDSYRITKRLVL